MQPTAAPPPTGGDLVGVVFPRVPAAGGRRSTSATGQAVLADAVRPVDPDLAAAVLAVRNWRSGYLEPYRRVTELAGTRPGAAAAIAAAGLASVHERFRFAAAHEETSLAEAVESGAGPQIRSVLVQGRAALAPGGLSVPYRGSRLDGDRLDRRLDGWLAAGTAEPSFAAAVRSVAAHPQWLDLRGTTVVVLGAGAEMGPVVSLLRWGAHVVAVDLPRPAVWERLIATARDSPGSLTVPVAAPADGDLSDGDLADGDLAAAAGVDLRTDLAHLLRWLAALPGPFVLGNYVYADGAAHVRAAVAVDALTEALLRRRDDVSLAFLATPTDAFVVPADAVADSAARYRRREPLHRAGRVVSAGRLFRPNYPGTLTLPDGSVGALNDALVPQQGPNYALAKRVQRWRALHERVGGRLVSLNVAPATRTRSVLRNRALAAAYAGAHRFGVEVFDPSTSNTLMAALLVHDLRDPAALANPAVPLPDPAELFRQGANHGGLWRTAYEPRSVLGLAVALGMLQRGA